MLDAHPLSAGYTHRAERDGLRVRTTLPSYAREATLLEAQETTNPATGPSARQAAKDSRAWRATQQSLYEELEGLVGSQPRDVSQHRADELVDVELAGLREFYQRVACSTKS